MRNRTKYITEGAIIAALYVILTYISMVFGIDKGFIQCRLSEALAVLPCIMPSAVPGLFVGCIISNLLTGCAIWDVIFGSLATLAAALVTSRLTRLPYLSSLPSIIANTASIPLILVYVYGIGAALPAVMLSVFVGELISSGILGTLLLIYIKKKSRL